MRNKFEVIYPLGSYGIIPRGFWTQIVTHADGTQTHYGPSTNVVTTNGKDFIASFLVSAAAAASTFTMGFVGCGTGTTPETVSDTALVAEVKRVAATVSHNGTGIVQLVASFLTNSAVGSITEYGIFNSSTGGVMLARDTETAVTVGATDTLTVTAQITFS